MPLMHLANVNRAGESASSIGSRPQVAGAFSQFVILRSGCDPHVQRRWEGVSRRRFRLGQSVFWLPEASACSVRTRARSGPGRLVQADLRSPHAMHQVRVPNRPSKNRLADRRLDLATLRDIAERLHLAGSEPEGVTYAEVDAGGVPALWCIPRRCDTHRVLLHSHAILQAPVWRGTTPASTCFTRICAAYHQSWSITATMKCWPTTPSRSPSVHETLASTSA
jgi:hypothetical protein